MPDALAGPFLVECDNDFAIGVDPLRDLAHQSSRYELNGPASAGEVDEVLGIESERARPTLHDEQGIAVAGRRQEPDTRSGSSNEGVRSRRRAVDESRRQREELRCRQPKLGGGFADRLEEAHRTIVRRGRNLADMHVPVLVDGNTVGERAADVDADREPLAISHLTGAHLSRHQCRGRSASCPMRLGHRPRNCR